MTTASNKVVNSKRELIQLICSCINGHSEGIVNNENINVLYSDSGCCLHENDIFLQNIAKLFCSDHNNIEWKFIKTNLYLLKLLSDILNDSNEMLSVQDCNYLRNFLINLVDVGIFTKLEKNLPFYKKSSANSTTDVFVNYNILKCTVYGLHILLKSQDLRSLILQECLTAMLISLYQIIFCPLKKPPAEPAVNNLMTLEIYNNLLEERKIFSNLLNDLKKTVHPVIYVKKTMLIFQMHSPIWLKKAVSQTLTTIILSQNGLDTILKAILEDKNDIAKNWRSVTVIIKIILSCKNRSDFKQSIVKQVINLLTKEKIENCMLYERVFIQCTLDLYEENKHLCMEVFVEYLFGFLTSFSSKTYKINETNLLHALRQNITLLHGIFIENTFGSTLLPLILLKKYTNILLRIYAILRLSRFTSTINDLKDIILKLVVSFKEDFTILMDLYLFQFPSDILLPFRNDIKLILAPDALMVHYSIQTIIFSVADSSETIKELLSDKGNLLVCLFGYLLHCISDSDRYFKKFDDVLLSLEDEYINETLEKKITIYKWLADLAENKLIQEKLVEQPDIIVTYFKNTFEKTINFKYHKETDNNNENFQVIFTTIMILHSLVKNTEETLTLFAYRTLYDPLNIIMDETSSIELKDLIKEVLTIWNISNYNSVKPPRKDEISEVEKALEDICDPLLPVRGHGLMSLTKLIEEKDKCALERKQYIFNIFQQNLKQEDSFLYLNAINGLATMANIFPDTTIQILCEEYTDVVKKEIENRQEVRLKLGEVLVKISKELGEMVVKYKALLLNTFLFSIKDEDYLMRASSLSNLGEVCRLLGYKLGSVITEILFCIHSIITTDKSVEVRRAAVLVLRQIFVGCDKEIIAYLKDDILPIYRELKCIYHNNNDDVTRLHAQLALEELNDKMKDFLFPNQTLNTEKKIFVL